MKLEQNTAYYVESDLDDTVLIAIDAKTDGRAVEWFDTCRDRAFLTRETEETEDSFRFRTERACYELKRLTLEIYNSRVVGRVDGHPWFPSTEALQQFYRDFPR